VSLLLINVVGHNGSGKTTLSKKLSKDLGLNNINGDEFRQFIIERFPFFKGMELSIPEERHTRYLSPLVIDYRFGVASALLKAGQSVLMDGSGATKEHRKHLFEHLSTNDPDIKRVIIYCKVPEAELIERLRNRDQESRTAEWEKVYTRKKKALFEPPEPNECDNLMIYTQDNYQVILQQVTALL
jgi:predicted kinase